LGDSLAFGLQLGKLQEEVKAKTYDPATFNTGFADDFARMLRRVQPAIRLVNESCPAETAATFIDGGCPFHALGHALHHDYPVAVPQLAAALAFLRSHPGQVSPITVDIGANDVLNLYFDTCKKNDSCTKQQLPGVLSQVKEDMDHILTALTAAAASSEVIVLPIYNPYPPGTPAGFALSPQLMQRLSNLSKNVAEAHGARVADGALAIPPATVCTLTFVCIAPVYDAHATDAGYLALAKVLWTASGYGQSRP
jgi:hypothetical protein